MSNIDLGNLAQLSSLLNGLNALNQLQAVISNPVGTPTGTNLQGTNANHASNNHDSSATKKGTTHDDNPERQGAPHAGDTRRRGNHTHHRVPLLTGPKDSIGSGSDRPRPYLGKSSSTQHLVPTYLA